MSAKAKTEKKTAVIIPAHNEEVTIYNVVQKVKNATGYRVIVINDASNDNTATLAENAGAIVITLPIQLGAWGAMQTGMRYALVEGFDTIVTFDADNQHPAERIKELADMISPKCDIAIGSCTRRGSLLRHVAWKLFRRLSGLTIQDLTSGFRAYSRKSFGMLASPKASLIDYQDLGILLILQNAGMKMSELSVTMNERKNDKSRIFCSWRKVAEYMVLTTILVLCYKKITLPTFSTQCSHTISLL